MKFLVQSISTRTIFLKMTKFLRQRKTKVDLLENKNGGTEDQEEAVGYLC